MPSYAEIEKQMIRINKSLEEFDKIIKNKDIPDEVKFNKSIKQALKSNSSNQNYNTNINIFTNNKNCNNVVYIGSYSSNSNLSRNSYNNVNGISYGPTLF